MSKTIGILETGRLPDALLPRHGSYPDMFMRLLQGHGFTFQSWPVLDGDFPPGVAVCDGWLITGSRHGAYETHSWIPPLEAFIREAVSAEIPMVGICFGHQIMAQALGGKVEKFPGGWGLGASAYQIDGLGQVTVNAVHQDQVTVLPPGAKAAGSSDFCTHAAISFGPHAWSLQPHPEMDAPFLSDLLDARREVFPAQDIGAAEARLDAPLDQSSIAAMMASILSGRTTEDALRSNNLAEGV